ncbi:Bug family tripartite tricarboxylate transporter substrate binding protein [Rhodoferax sediminis]|uniref:Tripartite tricarboxylate transporter substrate binding protein n=1 Tax=Rhodoferax sediminis TaxID=2509614 RepID=A0A515DDY0_9BURK|nr:tripartite tricarboxylate transporter substrate binding protein [Rhodoferax sediminis]QDL38613.1 tripartite tricarboxylate transporter substrate binding protein [Rhodoferax sediminis]
MKRRAFIQTPAALIVGTTLCSAALSQEPFPYKPIRFVIPSAPGGVSDAVARVYGERMSKYLKQPVLIENMPGAETLLAVRHVLKSPADGYTLIVSANTVVTLPHVDKSAGYNPSDFTGVSYLSKMPMALVVSGQSPFRTLAELVAAAKKAPGTITFASLGIGTTSHMPVELFTQSAGIKLQLIPYKGIPLAIPDVVSGRVTLMMGTSPSVGALIKAGKLRALAVTSETRSPSFPNTPAFAELGYVESTYELFLGLMAPAKIPPAVLKILSDAAEEAKNDLDLRERLEALGQELPSQTTPEQFNAFLRREEEKMKKLVKEANIQISRS